uniref:Si:dkey-25g12.4 n=1 Tax=Sparus aurata TaxID=8175 RepID=A0A671YWZ0_SPAAU
MPGLTGRSDPPPTKTVTVYRNGDAFFAGKKIVVNPRQVTTFDHFLASLTKGIEAPFGAVRKLYTHREGHRVQQLDDLKHGDVYVALHIHFQIQPVVHSKIIVSARWRRAIDESCTINVFTNGEILVPPARIRIPKYTLRSWEKVLTMVTDKVRLRTGAVHRLYTLEGRPVCGPTQLENNQHYVAVGAGKFKALPYEHCVPYILPAIPKDKTSKGCGKWCRFRVGRRRSAIWSLTFPATRLNSHQFIAATPW